MAAAGAGDASGGIFDLQGALYHVAACLNSEDLLTLACCSRSMARALGRAGAGASLTLHRALRRDSLQALMPGALHLIASRAERALSVALRIPDAQDCVAALLEAAPALRELALSPAHGTEGYFSSRLMPALQVALQRNSTLTCLTLVNVNASGRGPLASCGSLLKLRLVGARPAWLNACSALQDVDVHSAVVEHFKALAAAPLRRLTLRSTHVCALRGSAAFFSLLPPLEHLCLSQCDLLSRHVLGQPAHAVVTEALCLCTRLTSLELHVAGTPQWAGGFAPTAPVLTGAHLALWAGVVQELRDGIARPSAYRGFLDSYGAVHATYAPLPPPPEDAAPTANRDALPLQRLVLRGMRRCSAEQLRMAVEVFGPGLQHLEVTPPSAPRARTRGWGGAGARRAAADPGPWVGMLPSLKQLRSLRLSGMPVPQQVLPVLPTACPALREATLSGWNEVQAQVEGGAAASAAGAAAAAAPLVAGLPPVAVAELGTVLAGRGGRVVAWGRQVWHPPPPPAVAAAPGVVWAGAPAVQAQASDMAWAEVCAAAALGVAGQTAPALPCPFGCGAALPVEAGGDAAAVALDHGEVCAQAPLACSNGCGAMVPRADWAQHVLSTCPAAFLPSPLRNGDLVPAAQWGAHAAAFSAATDRACVARPLVRPPHMQRTRPATRPWAVQGGAAAGAAAAPAGVPALAAAVATAALQRLQWTLTAVQWGGVEEPHAHLAAPQATVSAAAAGAGRRVVLWGAMACLGLRRRILRHGPKNRLEVVTRVARLAHVAAELGVAYAARRAEQRAAREAREAARAAAAAERG